jgi:hypothetical protein
MYKYIVALFVGDKSEAFLALNHLTVPVFIKAS